MDPMEEPTKKPDEGAGEGGAPDTGPGTWTPPAAPGGDMPEGMPGEKPKTPGEDAPAE